MKQSLAMLNLRCNGTKECLTIGDRLVLGRF